MSSFIDASRWPIARLAMPDQVADASSDAHLADLQSLYARRERFVLLMTGAEIPRASPRFMKDYLAWSRDNAALQGEYCAGAIRIEPAPERRATYEKQAAALAASGKAAYPYRVVADDAEALELASEWLSA